MKVVDCQCHWYPEGFFEYCLDRNRFPRCERTEGGYSFELGPGAFLPMTGPMVDLDLLFERMSADGSDILVSSSEPVSVTGWDPSEAREAARVLNEEKAAAQERFPGRFIGLATVPLQDPAAAVEELDHAVSKLGLRGVCIGSNINGSPITSPELLDFYRRVEELGVPLFLHPTSSIAREGLPEYGLEYVLGYMFDTAVAALNLVFSHTLLECPELRVVHPHLGAFLPYLAGRIDFEYKTPWAGNDELPTPPSEYLARFYTDTVSETPSSLERALDFYGRDRVLFGSDFPWWTADRGIDFVKKTVDGPTAEKILESNARALFDGTIEATAVLEG
jgi:aminocarboxymuconate-semialdehyde decarboxylase